MIRFEWIEFIGHRIESTRWACFIDLIIYKIPTQFHIGAPLLWSKFLAVTSENMSLCSRIRCELRTVYSVARCGLSAFVDKPYGSQILLFFILESRTRINVFGRIIELWCINNWTRCSSWFSCSSSSMGSWKCRLSRKRLF